MAHEYRVTESEILLDAPILAVRRDRVVMPGGHSAAREIVEHFGAVAVAAVDENGRIALVEQYRHSVGKRLLELPAGLLDVADEPELACAERELREEAGLAASRWGVLVDLITSPGFAEEAVRVFLAQDLAEVARPEAEDEEADLTIMWVDLQEARERILSGDIVNSIAVAGIFAACEAVERGSQGRDVAEPFCWRPRSLTERRKLRGHGRDLKRM
ncbi:ADP-ribose pyrophosphatase [Corynebacterium capitovis DSM 44611]|uniref:NUDIX domain-containing protein n=1 Tax=Corynebacterium capitovis TaxID=131081 RepID=UPI00037D6111|nr:NUDIX hydrolase [Corynebacterium capitovis]WKD57716.1 ADP-ribose pyrophosphatase [Corynebacterium capitovis DSM 44611]